MTRIAILGCGWLGLPLAKHLANNRYSVNGSTTRREKEVILKNARVIPFLIDLEKAPDNLNDFLSVDELIITIPPKASNYAALIEGLISKIEASAIKRVIYTSSISVYGDADGIITEDTETIPKRDAVAQILAVEHLLLRNKKFKSTVIRLGGLINSERHPAYHLSGKLIKSPNELINLVHLDDCIAVISKLLKTKPHTNIYNLVNPYHPKKGDYYTDYCKKLNLPIPIINSTPNAVIKEVSSEKICAIINFEFDNNLILS